MALYALRMPKMGRSYGGMVFLRCWVNKGVGEGRSPYRGKTPAESPHDGPGTEALGPGARKRHIGIYRQRYPDLEGTLAKGKAGAQKRLTWTMNGEKWSELANLRGRARDASEALHAKATEIYETAQGDCHTPILADKLKC